MGVEANDTHRKRENHMSRTNTLTRVRFLNAGTGHMARAYVVGYLMGVVILTHNPYADQVNTFTMPANKVKGM